MRAFGPHPRLPTETDQAFEARILPYRRAMRDTRIDATVVNGLGETVRLARDDEREWLLREFAVRKARPQILIAASVGVAAGFALAVLYGVVP